MDVISEYSIIENKLKRKGIEEEYLPFMECKFNTLKILVGAAGPYQDIKGKEYIYLVSKLSNATTCDTDTPSDIKEAGDETFE